MEKVIPQSLNYAMIKPEAIDHQVRLVRFIPTANPNNAKQGDVIRFMLTGQNFYDPYSAYFKIKVRVPNLRGNNALSGVLLDRSAHSFIQRMIIRSNGTELERIENYDVMAAMINDMTYSLEQKKIHANEGFATDVVIQAPNGYGDQGVLNQGVRGPCGDLGVIKTPVGTAINEYPPILADQWLSLNAQSIGQAPTYGGALTPDIAYQYHTAQSPHKVVQNLGGYVPGNGSIAQSQVDEKTFEFTIPLFSGVLGVLMSEKKLVPLSLLPIEMEIQLSPHAFYITGDAGMDFPGVVHADYVVENFDLYSHVLQFEQEVHHSLESVVAEHGIFIHYQTFFQAPITTHSQQGLVSTCPINIHYKSINAIHGTFLSRNYYTNRRQRKLDFINPLMTSIQIRNGVTYIPSLPITVGGVNGGGHAQLQMETMKGWNKMHDVRTDMSWDKSNYYTHQGAIANPFINSLKGMQCNLGRFQWAISFEGEELGKDKTTITGERGMTPFDVNFTGGSWENTQLELIMFARVDLVVYVRPSLIVSVLGK